MKKDPQERIARTEANCFVSKLQSPIRPAQKVIGFAESDVSLHKTGIEHEGAFCLDDRLFSALLLP